MAPYSITLEKLEIIIPTKNVGIIGLGRVAVHPGSICPSNQ